MEVIDGGFDGRDVTYEEIKRDAARLLRKVKDFNDAREQTEDKLEIVLAYSLVKEEDICCNGIASDLFKSILSQGL